MVYDQVEIQKLLTRQSDFKDQGYSEMNELSNSEQAQLELLHILNVASAPAGLFDKIMVWLHKHSKQGNLDFAKRERPAKRDSIVENMRMRLDWEPVKPVVPTITLPFSKITIEVPTNDFLGQVHSLLSNKSIMHERNLLFPKGDPFAKPRFIELDQIQDKDNYWIEDIDCGYHYNQAYERYVKDKEPEKDKMVPILLFIDGTHYDEKGRLTSVPVRFTLGIFNMAARQRDEFWRPLGHIPNVHKGKPVSSFQASQEYHMMLQVILRSLADVQHSSGVMYRLEWCDSKNNPKDALMRMHFPLLKILGDTEGHDKNLRRYRCYGNDRQKSKCRTCSCPTNQLDEPFCHYLPDKPVGCHEWTLQEEKVVRQMVRDKLKEELNNISTHMHDTCFEKLEIICCDLVHGIYSTMEGCCFLHQILEGLIPLAIACLLGSKRATQAKSRQNKKIKLAQQPSPVTAPPKVIEGLFNLEDMDDLPTTDEEDSISDRTEGACQVPKDTSATAAPPTENARKRPAPTSSAQAEVVDNDEQAYKGVADDELGIQGAFSQKCKDKIDWASIMVGRCLRHQSCRDYERAVFPDGIVKPAKINGSEQPHVLLILLILLISDCPGKELREHLDRNTSSEDGSHKSRSMAWIGTLGQILQFAEMYTWEYISAAEFELLHRFIPLFMRDLKTVLARKAGNQMRTVKFHMLGHIMHAMYTSGPLRGLDGSYCESHMKGSKKAGKQTSRRQTTFAAETIKRENENMLVKTACRRFLPDATQRELFDGTLPMGPVPTTPSKSRPVVEFEENWFAYCDSQICRKVRCNDIETGLRKGELVACEWGETRLQEPAEDLLQQFATETRSPVVDIYSLARITCNEDYEKNKPPPKPRLFRARPSLKEGIPGRHDWCVFPAKEGPPGTPPEVGGDMVVARIICFMAPSSYRGNPLDVAECIVQPLDPTAIEKFPGQEIVYKNRFPRSSVAGQAVLRRYRCTSALRPIAVVPSRWEGTSGVEGPKANGIYTECKSWIVIEPKKTYASSFKQSVRDQLDGIV